MEKPPKITATIYPDEVEVVLTEARLKALELMNEQGIIYLVKSWIDQKEKQLDFNF
jgi:P pilus assembly chaperone PapD